MSWLLSTLVGPPSDEEDEGVEEGEQEGQIPGSGPEPRKPSDSSGKLQEDEDGGLEDDWKELRQSLKQQFRGVTSLLAGVAGGGDARAVYDKTEAEDGEETDEDSESGPDPDAVNQEKLYTDVPSAKSAPSPLSMDASAEEPGVEDNPSSPISSADSKARIKGVRDDLAELKGRVAKSLSSFSTSISSSSSTAFSSMLRVVTGEDLATRTGEIGSQRNKTKGEGAQRGPLAEGSETEAAEGEQALTTGVSEPSRVRFSEKEGDLVDGKAETPSAKEKHGDSYTEQVEESGWEFDDDVAASDLLQAAKDDLKAISGTLANGISGFSKLASNLFSPEVEDEEDEEDQQEEEEKGRKTAVGMSDDVIMFAHNLSMHPETWIEFPLPEEGPEGDDFRLTLPQQSHADAIEFAAPRLAALRLELTPSYMSEARFWRVYFVLLHSRLGEEEAALLSTQQVHESREWVLSALRKQTGSVTAEGEEGGGEGGKAEAAAAAGGGGGGTPDIDGAPTVTGKDDMWTGEGKDLASGISMTAEEQHGGGGGDDDAVKGRREEAAVAAAAASGGGEDSAIQGTVSKGGAGTGSFVQPELLPAGARVPPAAGVSSSPSVVDTAAAAVPSTGSDAPAVPLAQQKGEAAGQEEEQKRLQEKEKEEDDLDVDDWIDEGDDDEQGGRADARAVRTSQLREGSAVDDDDDEDLSFSDLEEDDIPPLKKDSSSQAATTPGAGKPAVVSGPGAKGKGEGGGEASSDSSSGRSSWEDVGAD